MENVEQRRLTVLELQDERRKRIVERKDSKGNEWDFFLELMKYTKLKFREHNEIKSTSYTAIAELWRGKEGTEAARTDACEIISSKGWGNALNSAAELYTQPNYCCI